jgi:CubicO group peptidase (beta-lactamase class C family)
MLRKAFTLIAVALLASSHLPAAAPPADAARMDQIARFYVDTNQFMGSVLVARGDEVVFSKSYGFANLEWQVPNALDGKFRIGSVTKQFTAAAILLLEERGKLKTGDPVKKYYPDAPAAWDQVTIYHLLTHTSGIPNFTSFPDYQKTEPLPSTAEETIKRFRDKPLEFAPGAEMRYSNSGYVLLGAIIEKASGMGYAQFLEESIFKPLGLKNTGYESNRAILPHRAAGYAPGRMGPENAGFVDMSVPFAAGALYSTVGDLHLWNRALFGHKLLSEASVKKMTTPPKGDYALGIAVGDVEGTRVFHHGGGIAGFNCKLAYYPDTHITVVALSNLNGGGADNIVDRLGRVALGKTVVLPSERKAVKVPRATLEKYVGTYQLRPGFDLWFRIEGDGLTVQATNQPPMPLRAESKTTFFPLPIDAEFEFVLDTKGKVTGVHARQGGRDTLAPRTSDTTPK